MDIDILKAKRKSFAAVLHKELESKDSSVLYLELWLAWCCDLVFDGGRGYRNRIQWGGRWLAWRTESTNEMDDGRHFTSTGQVGLLLLQYWQLKVKHSGKRITLTHQSIQFHLMFCSCSTGVSIRLGLGVKCSLQFMKSFLDAS
ncbi:hypothetical protein TNCV_583651 [Trichonephila clavipes]|nr:hypothetical protein TNCV_583651 [Trichonephila clavipes]